MMIRYDTKVSHGSKKGHFRFFFAAGGAKTRSAPQLRSAAGGDVLLTCPGQTRGGGGVAGARGGVAGARGGGKTKIPLFGARRYCTVLYHSIVKEIVQYDTYCSIPSDEVLHMIL